LFRKKHSESNQALFYCNLCQCQVSNWSAHVHSTAHINNLVDPNKKNLAREYLADMKRPRAE